MDRYIKLKDNKIIAVRYGKEIVAGEIKSDIGELGEALVDGSFEKSTPVEKAKPDTATELAEVKKLLQIIDAKLSAL